MADHQRQGPPHDLLLAVALGIVMAGPSIIGDFGGTMADFLGPAGVIMLPIVLVFVAHFLSTDQGNGFFNSITAGFYDSSQAVYLGILILLILLFYKRAFLSGGEDEDED